VVVALIQNYHPVFNNISYDLKLCLRKNNTNTSTSPARLPQRKRGVTILCLDGGGIRGLILTSVLSKMATDLFGNADEDGTEKLLKCFDLICGTSTGGILAVALTKGLGLSRAREMYYRLGSQIFAFGYVYLPARWVRYYTYGDYYSSTLLKQLLDNQFGEDSKMSSIKQKMFVTATDATLSRWKSAVIRTYDAPESQIEGVGDGKLTIPDALRITSAAPTYFAPVQYGDRFYIDGGMTSNNPTELGIFEAHDLFQDQCIDTIVSIGTGDPVDSKSSGNVMSFLDAIVNITTDSERIHERVQEWLKLTNPTPNYFRFTPPVLGSIALDESKEPVLLDMEKKTDEYMSQPLQLQMIARLKDLITKS